MSSVITYCFNAPITGQEVADLFSRSGINRPTEDVARIQTMIDHANLTITAHNNILLYGDCRKGVGTWAGR